MNELIPVVIPAYEPDEGLLTLCEQLKAAELNNIVIVDDGSGEQYQSIFSTLENTYDCRVLTHAVNLGKGRALKYAFNTLLADKSIIGCVTADSDGQHTSEDILKCIRALEQSPDTLILGCRNFKSDHIPFKSKIGNEITTRVSKFLCGLDVSDTQTGLRGIPRQLMVDCLSIAGERFEFETNMLLATKNKVAIKEVSIATIYSSKDNHRTHFDPIKDSFRIYLILGKVLIKYSFSSVASCLIDLLLFALFLSIFEHLHLAHQIILATVIARVISTIFNYLVNYTFVFKSNVNHQYSATKYVLLAVVIMSLSAAAVSSLAILWPNMSVLWLKIIVDSLLFFVSFHIQHKYFFTHI